MLRSGSGATGIIDRGWGYDFTGVFYLVRGIGVVAIAALAIRLLLHAYLHVVRDYGICTSDNNDDGINCRNRGGVNGVGRHEEAINHRRGDRRSNRNEKKDYRLTVLEIVVRLTLLHQSVVCFTLLSDKAFELATGFERSRFSIAVIFTSVFVGDLFPQSGTWPTLLIKACIRLLQHLRALLRASVSRALHILHVALRGGGMAFENMLSAINRIFRNARLAGQDIILSPLWAAAKSIWAMFWVTGAMLCTAIVTVGTAGTRIVVKLRTTLRAIGSAIVDAIGLLKTIIAQRRGDAGRDGRCDEEPTEAPEPSPTQIHAPLFEATIPVPTQMAPKRRPFPVYTPEEDAQRLERRIRGRSRSDTCWMFESRTPAEIRRQEQQERGRRRSTAGGNRDQGLGTGGIEMTGNGLRREVQVTRSTAGVDSVVESPETIATPKTNGNGPDRPAESGTKAPERSRKPTERTRFSCRPCVPVGGEVHCCKLEAQDNKEIWVRTAYYADCDSTDPVPGVFKYLPVTLLRASFNESSTIEGFKWYVQPGGQWARNEWAQEDGRVIWEVPQDSLVPKLPAAPEEICDSCHRTGRQCHWTPDKLLERLCDHCADAPRRHLNGCGPARHLGHSWYRACDCLGV